MENPKKSKNTKKDEFADKMLKYGVRYIDFMARNLIAFAVILIIFAVVPFLRNLDVIIKILIVMLLSPLMSPLLSKVHVGEKLMVKYIEWLSKR